MDSKYNSINRQVVTDSNWQPYRLRCIKRNINGAQKTRTVNGRPDENEKTSVYFLFDSFLEREKKQENETIGFKLTCVAGQTPGDKRRGSRGKTGRSFWPSDSLVTSAAPGHFKRFPGINNKFNHSLNGSFTNVLPMAPPTPTAAPPAAWTRNESGACLSRLRERYDKYLFCFVK